MRTTPLRSSNNGFVKERTDETAFDSRLSRSPRERRPEKRRRRDPRARRFAPEACRARRTAGPVRSRSSIAWRTGASKRKEKRLAGARHGRQSRFRSSPWRGNRRRQASRSSPRTCRSNSPKLTPAAASKASPRGGSRLRTATRLNSPRRGSRRKRSSRSFVSTNSRSSKARSGPGSKGSRTMSGALSPASSRHFSRSRSSSAPSTSWPRRLPGSARAIRPG